MVLTLASATSYATDHATVLAYHHVSSHTPASTSTTKENFITHLRYLEANNYSVWTMGKIVTHLQTNQPIPENTVALTFDDAYTSVYHTVYPLMQKRGWPFTIFVNTDAIVHEANLKQAPKGKSNKYLTWEQLQELVDDGIEIGNHSATHDHLLARLTNESEQDWRQRIHTNIEQAQAEIISKLKVTPTLFAYPYGEFNPALQDIVAAHNLVGVGQHSGVVDAYSDFLALPRFPVATNYDSLQQFGNRVKAQRLPIDERLTNPANGNVQAKGSAQNISLYIDEKSPLGDKFSKEKIACYASGQGAMQIEWQSDLNFVIRAKHALKTGRTKFNCTAPSTSGYYFWWSFLTMVPRSDGTWYSW